jgi:aminodeoxyfutalosine synthase
MHREDLLHMIWDAGFRPVERNTRYETVKDYGPPPSQAERRATPQSVLS